MEGRKFHQVYLLAGVNELTNRIDDHEVTPAFDNWAALVRHIMIQLHEARASLLPLSDHVVICEITGMHLGLYNTSGSSYPTQQQIINNGVMRINEYIADMNRDFKVYSPYISGLTHKMKGTSKLHHRYVQTTYDGLHYNNITAYKLAENMVQNICDLFLDLNSD